MPAVACTFAYYNALKMPFSRKERIASASGGGGGGAISETLVADNSTSTFLAFGEGTTNIPAGQYKTTVYNAGVTDITANGATVPPGEQWVVEAYENRTGAKFDLTPAVAVVVPANGAASYQIITPSS